MHDRRHTKGRPRIRCAEAGVSLIELTTSLAVAAIVVLGLNGIVGTTLQSRALARERNELTRDARFAVDRIADAVAHSTRLLLPLDDNPVTTRRESVREEPGTLPGGGPGGGGPPTTAVLAIALPAYSDLDFDGFPDADNDRDGAIDEDTGADMHNDAAPGLYLIDDDGDGNIDEGASADDDETGGADEDRANGIDDDSDGGTDEDAGADRNADACPGICTIDDDGDMLVDEGADEDDDEDGAVDEDWLDVVVYHLDGGDLVERWPVPWDENAAGGVTGRDFVSSVIAGNVTRMRVERVGASPDDRFTLVDLSLDLTGPSGATVSVTTRMRVGGAL